MNQFMTDEYVLGFHGPLLYEARVRISEPSSSPPVLPTCATFTPFHADRR